MSWKERDWRRIRYPNPLWNPDGSENLIIPDYYIINTTARKAKDVEPKGQPQMRIPTIQVEHVDTEKGKEKETEPEKEQEDLREREQEEEKEREREKERAREREREKEKEKERERERERDKEREREAERERERDKEKERPRERDRDKDRDKERGRGKGTHKERERKKDRDKENGKEREVVHKKQKKGKNRERGEKYYPGLDTLRNLARQVNLEGIMGDTSKKTEDEEPKTHEREESSNSESESDRGDSPGNGDINTEDSGKHSSIINKEEKELEELEGLFDKKEGTVQWDTFYGVLKEKSKLLQEKVGAGEVMRLITGAHQNKEGLYHFQKYQTLTSFFGPLVSEGAIKAILEFYRDKVAGSNNFMVDRTIGWFLGVLLPNEEEDLLSSVPPQTFIVYVGGAEESTLVFAYNDYDDDSKQTTSTFLISIYYDIHKNKFTGMDMENPEADEDVEYENLYDIVTLFKKLGYRPLSPHVLFGYTDKK